MEIKLPVRISSPVIHGRGLGHKLGAPTINQALPSELSHLPYGVYFSLVYVDGIPHHAVTNVGVKPTVSDTDAPVCETHLLSGDFDLYGAAPVTELLFYRRKEQKFGSYEELTAAILADADAARKYFINDN